MDIFVSKENNFFLDIKSFIDFILKKILWLIKRNLLQKQKLKIEVDIMGKK